MIKIDDDNVSNNNEEQVNERREKKKYGKRNKERTRGFLLRRDNFSNILKLEIEFILKV